MKKDFDSKILKWKMDVSKFLKGFDNTESSLLDLESEWMDVPDTDEVSSIETLPYSEDSKKNHSSKNSHTTGNEETESAYTDVSDDQVSNDSIQKDLGNESDVQQTEGECHMYDITFDNVNQRTHSRVYSLGKSSTVLNMVQAFACKEGIPTGHSSD
jgi:hypothetical protein